MQFWKDSAGITLVEFVVTIAILAIISSIAAPSFVDMIKRNKRFVCANELNGALQFARSESVRRNLPVTITADGGIANGVQVFSDANANNSVDSDEVIEVVSSCDGASVEVVAGTIEFSYRPNGQTDMAAPLAIEVCDAADSGEAGRSLYLLTSGALRNRDLTCD